jgi:sulfur relay (sulfurtransferase) complex TusBCD TusD component (DsrE family)
VCDGRCRRDRCSAFAQSIPAQISSQRRRYGEKIFVVRDSYVTKMLTKPDFQSIYNMFIAMAIWMSANIFLQVCVTAGRERGRRGASRHALATVCV